MKPEPMKTHAELYPEQYSHPLVGRRVTWGDGKTGTVRRVVPSRFGLIALIDSTEPDGILATSLTVLA